MRAIEDYPPLRGAATPPWTPLLAHLGLLDLAREVHGDGLPLGELVEGLGAGFPVAVAGALHAAEGQLHLGPDGGGVDVDDTELQLVDGGERRPDVPGVDGAREPVLGGVGALDALREGR